MLVDEQSSPEQIAAFRRMSPARRLALAEELYWSARELKAAGLRAQYADWSPQQVRQAAAEIFAHART
jgi:hypothetical protein